MSFRYYRRYVYGNPQRRVFLPNFWMILVPNEVEKPKNFVQFKVPLEMTNRDVKNYLEKIYNVPVVNVRSVPRDAKLKQDGNDLMKKGEDYRSAYVQMPVGTTFEFPKLFPDEKRDEQRKQYESAQKKTKDIEKEYMEKFRHRKNMIDWFT